MSKGIEALKKLKIGILAGGASSEREISLRSGKEVFNAFKQAGLDAILCDVNEVNLASSIEQTKIDVAFIALHGSFGEDGTVQHMLSQMKIPYTGSGPEASRAAFDKLESKRIFFREGIPSPEYKVARSFEEVLSLGMEIPFVVKPRLEGSSMGLSVVFEETEIEQAIEEALKYGMDMIVERFVPGREITVGILKGRALPIVEIVPSGGTYDFDSKYLSDKTRYLVPAEFKKDIYETDEKYGVKAHDALGCKGFSRVDMIVEDDKNIHVLEVNTIPGLTHRSLLPMAARQEGLDFYELCVKMLLAAFDDTAEG